MSGEQASDPYLRKINSMINAPVREQLEAIANWHDSKHPSRMALGAVASAALNYVNILEAQNHRLEAALRGLEHWAANCPGFSIHHLATISGTVRQALGSTIDAGEKS